MDQFKHCWIEEGRLLHSNLPLAHDLQALRELGVASIINCAATGVGDPDGLADYGGGERGDAFRRELEDALRAAGIPETQLDIPFGMVGMDPDGAELSRAWEHYLARRDRGVVLVHCRAGQDRSATVLGGIIARRDGLSGRDAIELVRERSCLADPDPRAADLIDHWLAFGDEGPPEDAEGPA